MEDTFIADMGRNRESFRASSSVANGAISRLETIVDALYTVGNTKLAEDIESIRIEALDAVMMMIKMTNERARIEADANMRSMVRTINTAVGASQ